MLAQFSPSVCMFVCKSLHPLTHREVLRSGGEEAVVEGGEGEVGDKLGVRVQERHVRLMNEQIVKYWNWNHFSQINPMSPCAVAPSSPAAERPGLSLGCPS